MTTDLKPIDPQEAKEWYLENRRGELADATYKAHKYRLSPFVEWCDTEGDVSNMNDLSGRPSTSTRSGDGRRATVTRSRWRHN